MMDDDAIREDLEARGQSAEDDGRRRADAEVEYADGPWARIWAHFTRARS